MTQEDIKDKAAEYSRTCTRYSDETMAVDLYEAYLAGVNLLLDNAKEELLSMLEELQTEYKRRMHDDQAKEDYIYASGLCGAISRLIKIVKED